MERLELSGEIDLVTAPWQFEKLVASIESRPDEQGSSVEIDCSDLRYICLLYTSPSPRDS